MAEKAPIRRLAAILAADVVSYSRLVCEDEEGTIARLRTLRDELIAPCIARHRGRVFKTTGDGLLAEFASVVDAVRCAVEMQQAIAQRTIHAAGNRSLVYRVGVNLGDVVIDGDDILGHDVNVAARLEGLADPGGVYISDKVYQEVRDRLDLAFQDMGEKTVRNIRRPLRVWRWLRQPAARRSPGRQQLPQLDKPALPVLPFALSGKPEIAGRIGAEGL